MVVLAEIAINYFPGVADASQRTVTVVEWFTLFQNHWFVGLRNLGLLNHIRAVLLAPTMLAIYAPLRRDNEAAVLVFSSIEFGCLVISAVMLRGKVFSKASAYAGILGNVC